MAQMSVAVEASFEASFAKVYPLKALKVVYYHSSLTLNCFYIVFSEMWSKTWSVRIIWCVKKQSLTGSLQINEEIADNATNMLISCYQIDYLDAPIGHLNKFGTWYFYCVYETSGSWQTNCALAWAIKWNSKQCLKQFSSWNLLNQVIVQKMLEPFSRASISGKAALNTPTCKKLRETFIWQP